MFDLPHSSRIASLWRKTLRKAKSVKETNKQTKHASFLRIVPFWTLKGPEGYQPQLCQVVDKITESRGH